MQRHTVIPAVRSMGELEHALGAPSPFVFVLDGEIIQLRRIVQEVKSHKKKVFIHLDLIKGIKEDEASIHFLAEELRIDGIISTRASSLQCAKKYGLKTVQRGFLIDSQSMRTIIKSAKNARPDFLELLPAFSYPKVREIKAETGAHIILGGFVEHEEDLSLYFNAGATAVSTSDYRLWMYNEQER